MRAGHTFEKRDLILKSRGTRLGVSAISTCSIQMATSCHLLGRCKVIDLGGRIDDLASIELFADNPTTMAIVASHCREILPERPSFQDCFGVQFISQLTAAALQFRSPQRCLQLERTSATACLGHSVRGRRTFGSRHLTAALPSTNRNSAGVPCHYRTR